MAEAAGGREQPAPPDAAPRADEEPEAAPHEAAAGRRRERRSGVPAVGAAERFPGGSPGPAAAPEPDAGLLEAARAAPRRSSIIKVRAGRGPRRRPRGCPARPRPPQRRREGSGRLCLPDGLWGGGPRPSAAGAVRGSLCRAVPGRWRGRLAAGLLGSGAGGLPAAGGW